MNLKSPKNSGLAYLYSRFEDGEWYGLEELAEELRSEFSGKIESGATIGVWRGEDTEYSHRAFTWLPRERHCSTSESDDQPDEEGQLSVMDAQCSASEPDAPASGSLW